MNHAGPPRILFVCLGNICRSPLAEAALRAAADREGLAVDVDSAGTGDWHIGQPPDPRAIATAKRHNIDISGFRARQVTAADFDDFDHVIALDAKNFADLRRLRSDRSRADLSMLMDYVGSIGESVADPYFGTDESFETTWCEITRAVQGLVERISSQPSGYRSIAE